jgi:hypothetical protein
LDVRSIDSWIVFPFAPLSLKQNKMFTLVPAFAPCLPLMPKPRLVGSDLETV